MTIQMSTVTIALWVANYGYSFPTLEAWVTCAERQIEKAAEAKADFLLWPEWLSDQWLGFAPKGLDLSLSPWAAQTAESVMPRLGKKANDAGIALIAGTTASPSDKAENYYNRARIYLNNHTVHQDKLLLTPPELALVKCINGSHLSIFQWQGRRIAVVICLDCEWPHLSAQLTSADIDLILIPSQTSRISGYHRVHKAAQTRAIELFCPVAVVGGAGTTPQPDVTPKPTDPLTNVGGAAVYLPCEKSFANGDGIAFQTGPMSELENADGLLHIIKNIPVGHCRRVRQEGGAEAWPGDQMKRTIIVQEI